MGTLDGRVAIITGAGRGLGREHALLFASQGAKVVVNDLGGANDGSGSDMTPAQQTVADIKAMGGEAIVNGDNVADWAGAKRMVDSAIETFGDLDILVPHDRLDAVETALLGRAIDPSAADFVLDDIRPIDDVRSTADYRARVSRNIVHAWLTSLAGDLASDPGGAR